MFVLSEQHVLGICDRIIERGYDLNIWAYARIDTVKDRYLEKLKKAGFNWMALGIESGSKYVRDGVDKGRFSDTDIVKTTYYVTDMVHRADLASVRDEKLGDHEAASTLLEVAGLASPDYLIEIDVIAVVPAR